MKVDCSNTLDFFIEAKRMCDSVSSCTDCDVEEICPIRMGVTILTKANSQKWIDIVQLWSNTHQQKTILDDFKEKFPNVEGMVTKRFCPGAFGYDLNCGKCTGLNEQGVEECWNKPIKGGD